MKRETTKIAIFILIGFLFFYNVSAIITVGNLSDAIETKYGPEGELKGWINVSIQNEDSDELFKDNKGNSIDLIDILQLNKEKNNLAFSCDTKNCVTNYEQNESFSEKTFNLGLGKEKTFGILFNGKVTGVSEVGFTFESNASASCSNQFEIFFGNSRDTFKNYKATSNACEFSRSYGCFNSSSQTENFALNSNGAYCQKIKISPTPELNVGAWMKKESGNSNVTFFLIENAGGPELPEYTCKVSNSEISSQGSEKSCVIQKLIHFTKEYYLCVKKDSDDGKILIKSSSQENKCGYYSGSGTTPVSAYQFFMEGVEYASPQEIILVGGIKTSIAEKFNDYLSEVYLTGDCSSGCIVPIKISSKVDQEIKIKNLTVEYSRTEGVPEPITSFSDIKEIPPKVSTSGFVNIYLDEAGFIAPKEVKKHNITFYIGSEDFLKKEIEIQSIPVINYVVPLTAFSAYPAEFIVSANSSSGTISSYTWKFSDDNIIKTTQIGKIKHTFNSTGEYSLEITVKDSLERIAKKTFQITVQKPEEAIAFRYNKLKSNLIKVEQDINQYPAFVKKQISETLRLEEKSEKLNYYLRQNSSADTLEKKNAVLEGLLNLTIPEGITTTTKANTSFFPKIEKINLEILKEIGQSQYNASRSEEYREQILLWQYENVDIHVEYTGISEINEGEQKYLLGYYFVSPSKKETSLDPYVIVKKMEGFKQDPLASFSLIEKTGYYYFSLINAKKDFYFIATEGVDFLDLPLFVSPSFRYIELSEDIPTPDGDGPFYGKIKWGWLTLVIILILIIAFGIYLFLQSWYKYKYETYLFKGRNNMYNLITFIEAQKKLNVSDSDIIKKLKSSGWNSEQVNYVINKYLGKRTGMVEIPIKNPFDAIQENQKNENPLMKKPFGPPQVNNKRQFMPQKRDINKQDKK